MECGEKPLELRRQNISLKYAAKISNAENHPTAEILSETRQQNYMRENQKSFLKSTRPYLKQITADRVKTNIFEVPPWYLTPPEVDTSTHDLFKETSDLAMRAMTRENMWETNDDALRIYTDGSRDGRGRVGAAFYVPQRQHEEAFRLTDQVAILTAELIAIRQVLLYLMKEKTESVVIYCDSLSALQSLERGESRTRPNLLREIIHLNHSINLRIGDWRETIIGPSVVAMNTWQMNTIVTPCSIGLCFNL